MEAAADSEGVPALDLDRAVMFDSDRMGVINSDGVAGIDSVVSGGPLMARPPGGSARRHSGSPGAR